MAFGPNFRTPARTRDLPPRAQALNARLSDVIEEFRRYYPDTTDTDVRRALDATGEQHGGAVHRWAAVPFVVAGLIAAGVGALVAGGRLPENVPPAVWLGAAAAIAGVVAALTRIGRQD